LPRSPVLMLLVFALTLFLSATLLFMVEPMIGKMILPLQGGTPAVWNTCMVFFQAVLLLGYGYAHLSTIWLGARKQAVLHLVLLLTPFLFLPVAVNRGLIKGDENPIFVILLVLSLSVGLQMFVVSASAPLLQKWFASSSHPSAKDPYFLYGASNLGSMLALLAYPTVVEPNLRLAQQALDWSVGYGMLAALTALCAVFLWRSPQNVETSAKSESMAGEELHPSGGRSSKAIHASTPGIRASSARPESIAPADALTSHTLTGAVTWKRVLRWVALAFVPSSLMLGATTYITTDIAAIPLLWVAPLAFYLLSFILVFSRLLGWVHKSMVLVMPLLVLLLLFFMLSGLQIGKHWIVWSIGMHLATLFVVAMVCHGELARDRPAAKDLTGYFLWMSVGGVLGGLFNGLVAPLLFTGIVEYELAIMLACFLAPPLGITKERAWGRHADVVLAGLFVAIGAVLLLLRLRDRNLPSHGLASGPWPWQLAALVLGLAIGLAAAWRAREKRFDHWMDLLLPLCLGLLLVGLSWGLYSNAAWPRLGRVAKKLNFEVGQVYHVLTYGVPLVMCYTFVERSLRLALGAGAILLSASFCDSFDSPVLHQERSFFGLLYVTEKRQPADPNYHPTRRLFHGTTLHGTQFLEDGLREEPTTYYHHSSPIGQVMDVYNRDNRRNLAVIGLGTGTMACYARPSQNLTFYDIDPAIRRLSFDEDKPYFTYVGDARQRGVHVDLVLGDARLTLERKRLKASEKYGILVVDAFSSDAIPIHLITLQALDVYLDKLTTVGLLAFHISNRHLDLRPVLANLAKERGLSGVYQRDDQAQYPGKSRSTWVVLARKSAYLDGLRAWNDWEYQREQLRMALLPLTHWPDNGSTLATYGMLLYRLLGEDIAKREAKWKVLEPADDEKWPELQKVGVWTDDYSNLLSVFMW
jgi:hypothetical protein